MKDNKYILYGALASIPTLYFLFDSLINNAAARQAGGTYWTWVYMTIGLLVLTYTASGIAVKTNSQDYRKIFVRFAIVLFVITFFVEYVISSGFGIH